MLTLTCLIMHDEGVPEWGANAAERAKRRRHTAAHLAVLGQMVLDAYARAGSSLPDPCVKATPAKAEPRASQGAPAPAPSGSVPRKRRKAAAKPGAEATVSKQEAATEAPGEGEGPEMPERPVYSMKGVSNVSPPSIESMREAGYLESAAAMQSIWAWAKTHRPEDGVWPTPTSQAQEALTFDACGWPTVRCSTLDARPTVTAPVKPLGDCTHPTGRTASWPLLLTTHSPAPSAASPQQSSTASEWLAMLQYWTVLREQLIGGAPRARRNEVTASLGRHL